MCIRDRAKDVCRVSGDGDKLEIGFNNRYLMEALRYAPADKVKIELNTGVSPAIIVPVEGEENFLYMVLPVRLKSADVYKRQALGWAGAAGSSSSP